MKTRSAFTMLELIFVIVIMGIIGKFGVEFLAQAYKTFIYSSVNNSLQSKSATAVEFISSRLEYRIKDSVIARSGTLAGPGPHVGVGSANDAMNATILEWVSYDIDGYRSTARANWSGIIDLDNIAATTTLLISPDTNTTAADDFIQIFSYVASGLGTSTINDAALYFIGSNSDVTTDYGWNTLPGTPLPDQTGAMHPINATATLNQFAPAVTNFAGIDVYEYYKLAWTAYAIVHEDVDADGNRDLVLCYDYQPWNGETLTNAKRATIMNNVDTFRFTAIGSILKIQVCTQSNIIDGDSSGGYSLCKEKTIF